MDERLFPELPEDLSALSDEELAELLARHETVVNLINAEDEDFLRGLSAEDVLAQFGEGVEQIETIVAEQRSRAEAVETYVSSRADLTARATAHLAEETEGGDEGDGGDGDDGGDEEDTGTEAEAQLAAEETGSDVETADGNDSGTQAEPQEAVVATVTAAGQATAVEDRGRRQQRVLRRVPAASRERTPAGRTSALVAAAGVDGARPGQELDRLTYARAVSKTADRWGRVAKHDGGIEQRILIASASFDFPEERRLHASDWEANSTKIAAVVPNGIPGVNGLVASGGLCAPLEPIYTMPNFATRARPVRDALPTFNAERGGVNVPTATSIGDITTAIDTITEDEDALGGTYATKSCQALACPAYTEVPITILSHCREYGNLNAMAWPEKIAHENDLTMAAHARTADGYLLQRIKTLSINVSSPQVLGAYADLVDVLLRTRASIIYVLRMDEDSRFRVVMPFWVADLLADDAASTQFDRFQSQQQMIAHLSSLGFAVTLHLDDVTGAAEFSAEAAGVVDNFPTVAEIAVFPEGEFIHVDSGELELGIVRDSTLNSRNDHQLFGETFENVARLGPAQGARWLLASVCPSGEFPSLSAARC